jgi:hypothetical protein
MNQMMNGWLRQLALMVTVRTGFSAQIVVCFVIAAVAMVLTVGFLCAAAFVWLAGRYDPLTASLILAGVFLLIAVIAVVAGALARRRNIERARLELAARKAAAGWLDPRLLSVGLEIGRTIGWRRIISLAGVAIFAAGLAKEWTGSSEKKPPPES